MCIKFTEFFLSSGDRQNSPSSRPWRASYSEQIKNFIYNNVSISVNKITHNYNMSNFLLNEYVAI